MTDPRRKVIVLDDDEAVGATIGLIAESVGFDVVLTIHFDDFWTALETEAPTHVTLDLSMPEVDGIEAMRRLAAHGFDGIVIVSSGLERRVLDAAQRSAIEHGLAFAGVLPKPFRPDDLRRLLLLSRATLAARATGAPIVVDAAMLAAAMEARELTLAFQPKVSCVDGDVVGFEALARWRHREAGSVPPDVFVRLAEREGLIDVLTEQVFALGLDWLRRTDPQGTTHLSLNLSAASLGDVAIADRIERACRTHDVDPSRVVLELTETASTDDQVTALDVLTRFRIKGLALSLDDFGTGHSTLVQLARQPFSELKIDRQFVMGAATSSESRTIIRAMVSLAHGLGLVVTAEGVEDAGTFAYLAELGCDRAQGYYIGRPVPEAEIDGWRVAWRDRVAAGVVGGRAETPSDALRLGAR